MIEVHNLGLTDSVFNQFMAEMRDTTIQQDRMRFRRNLERIGEIMAYEISKTLEYEEEEITTPLGIKEIRTAKEQPVIATHGTRSVTVVARRADDVDDTW